MKKFVVFLTVAVVIVGLVACDEGVAATELPDLEIVGVHVSNGRMPNEEFPYHEYLLVVKVRNLGGNIVSGDLYINAGDDQENKKVSNKNGAFELARHEEFEIPYQILKPNREARNFQIQIDAGDDQFSKKNGGLVEESNEKNNFYDLQIF